MAEGTALEALRTKYLSTELVEELTGPTPKELIRTRPIRGGGKVSYVPSPHFIRKLNDCFSFLWSYEVPQTIQEGEQIVAKGRLTVHIPLLKKRTTKKYLDGGREVTETDEEFEILDVVKEQSGSSEVKRWTSSEYMKDKKGNAQKDKDGNYLFKHRAGDVIDLGDDYKAAGTDAMKKSATHFGMFLDVYESRASTEEGGITEGQSEAFYFRAEEAGMDHEKADKWAEEQLGKPKDDWTGYDLMLLVPKLLDMAEEAKKKEESI